jgi:hypothetical protein
MKVRTDIKIELIDVGNSSRVRIEREHKDDIPLWYEPTYHGFDVVCDDEELEKQYQALKETV